MGMLNFTPIRQVRVSEEVTEQLKRSILQGHFKPGDRLPPERELAEQLKVSRVAIREALRVLQTAGFTVTRPGALGGTFVTNLSFQHLSDAFLDLFLAEKISVPELNQVRLVIEPEMTRMAATRVTAGYAKKLKDALDAEDRPSASLEEDRERKTAVHFILAEMCGNRLFEALILSLLGLTWRVIKAVDPDYHVMHPAGMHRPIVEAVLAGNPKKAALAMQKHALEFGQILSKMEKSFRKRNPPAPFT
jgi:GntR family transcriptional regulator, transcriptional repressor for pyruvate dehydrogenase complex